MGLALDIMLHAFLLTLSGIPVIYSGDEIGQLNDRTYREDPAKSQDSRYLHRGKFDWEAAKRSMDGLSYEGRIRKSLCALSKIRKSHRAFVNEADTWLVPLASADGDHSVIGIGRYHKGEKIIAVFNFSPAAKTVYTEEKEKYSTLISSGNESARKKTAPSGLSCMQLPGYGYSWHVIDYGK